MNTSGVRGVESSITWKHRGGVRAEGSMRKLQQGGERQGQLGCVGKKAEPRTNFMFSTGGSMNREPRLDTMKEVTQKATRSWRKERTISIRCISLHAFSHSPADKRPAALRVSQEGIRAVGNLQGLHL